jgi:chromosome segregation ATPase
MSSGFSNQTIVNLSVNEIESANFFSKMQNEGGTKEINLEGVTSEASTNDTEVELQLGKVTTNEINLDKNTTEMLDRVNSTQRTIGHNKFQQRIEELEQEIDRNKSYQKEQDMKLNLFKKTISTLQNQLQERGRVVGNLENAPNSNKYEKQLEDQSEQIKNLTLENVNLNLKIESLNNNLDKQTNEIVQLKNEKESIFLKLTNLKNEYQMLIKNYQIKVNDLESITITTSELQNKLNLEHSIRENLENEIFMLKNNQSSTIELENLLLEKNNEIQALTEKIEKIEKVDIEKTNNKTIPTTTIKGGSRGIVRTYRGLHITRKTT